MADGSARFAKTLQAMIRAYNATNKSNSNQNPIKICPQSFIAAINDLRDPRLSVRMLANALTRALNIPDASWTNMDRYCSKDYVFNESGRLIINVSTLERTGRTGDVLDFIGMVAVVWTHYLISSDDFAYGYTEDSATVVPLPSDRSLAQYLTDRYK